MFLDLPAFVTKDAFLFTDFTHKLCYDKKMEVQIMKKQANSFSFTGFGLKYIAMASMTIDHAGAVFLPAASPLYTLFRGIGRIAFPIFCFLLVEGYLHTSNHQAYLKRLLLFALISEIPFDMAFFRFPAVRSFTILGSHQNVFFTLAFAFFAMMMLDLYWFTNRLTGFAWLFVIAILAEWLNFDYGLTGIMVIVIIFIYKRFRTDIPELFLYILAVLPLFSFHSISGLCVALAIPFLLLYNGEKGKPLPGNWNFPAAKYLFYAYYPIHLAIIGILAHVLF